MIYPLPTPWVVVTLYQLCAVNTCEYFNDGGIANFPDEKQCIEEAFNNDLNIIKIDNGRYIKSLSVCIRDDRFDRD